MYYPDATMPGDGRAGDLSANDFAETDADDPAWADLIKQVPYSEMTNVIYNGFHLTQRCRPSACPVRWTKMAPRALPRA